MMTNSQTATQHDTATVGAPELNVLMVSLDRRIFDPKSQVRARMLEYGLIFNQLHIIVFTKQSQNFSFEQLAPNIWVYPTNSFAKLDYIFDALKVAKKELVLHGEFSADIVTAQDPYETGLAAFLIARKYKRKLQIQLHTDLFDPYFSDGEGFAGWRRRLIAKFILPRAQCVRVVSGRVKDRLLERHPSLKDRIAVLPIYVDVAYFEKVEPKFDLHKRYPQFSFIILMASRLSREKNIPLAVEVFGEVLKRYPRAGLLVVGEGPERNTILKKAAALGIANSVVIEPWQEDLISYYKTSNVFLLTSIFEGYGMALIEAAACGTPIVSSDVGIASQLIKNRRDSFVCAVNDRACFVQQILDLIENHERRIFNKLNKEESLGGLVTPTKEEYLLAYKRSVEQCFAIEE